MWQWNNRKSKQGILEIPMTFEGMFISRYCVTIQEIFQMLTHLHSTKCGSFFLTSQNNFIDDTPSGCHNILWVYIKAPKRTIHLPIQYMGNPFHNK